MTTIESPQNVKKQVQEHYGAIAAAPEKRSCCGSGPKDTSCMSEGYEGIGTLEIADLGLGCGTPASYAGLAEGLTVLDLGSGAGIDVFIAANEIGASGRAIGVDMTPQMVDRARQNALKLGITNAEFRLGEIEALPVESGSVDRILSNCVLNLVPDKERAFQEMFRTLRPGGSFAVSDIVTTGDMPSSVRGDAELYAACVSGALDRDAYLALIRAAGFRDVEVVREKQYPQFCTEAFGLFSITVTGRK